MSVFAFTACTGTPGVTTATLATAVHWDRPVLVIEADVSNVGAMMTGFFRGGLDLPAGMHQVSLATSRHALTAEALLDPDLGISIPVHALAPMRTMPIPALPAGHRMWVIPGYRDLAIIDGVHTLWQRLPALFASLHERGIDVLLDLGRLSRDDARFPLLDGADQVVVLAATTMTDLNRLHKRIRLPDLEPRVHRGGNRYGLLLTRAPAEAVAPTEFAKAVLPLVGTVPFDPLGAAVFAHGREDTRPARNPYRAGLRRVVLNLRHRITTANLDPVGSGR